MSDSNAQTKKRGSWTRWAKLAISAGLLWYVVGMVEWEEARGYLRSADLRYLALFVCVLPATVGLSVLKWWRLLAARDRHVSYWRLYGLYVLGQFYHNALPSSVGGDVVRGVMVNKEIGSVRETVSSIAAERLTGMTVLALLGIVAALVSEELRGSHALLAASGMSIVAFLILIAALLFVPVGGGDRFFARIRWLRGFWKKAQGLHESMLDYRHRPWVLIEALATSMLFYLGTMVSAYLACRAVGEPVPVATILIAVPIVHLVGVLPVSLNGIGLKEWAFTAAFAALGAPPTVGLIVALLLRVRLIVWSVAGYAIWTMRDTGRPQTPQATPVVSPTTDEEPPMAGEATGHPTSTPRSTLTEPERV